MRVPDRALHRLELRTSAETRPSPDHDAPTRTRASADSTAYTYRVRADYKVTPTPTRSASRTALDDDPGAARHARLRSPHGPASRARSSSTQVTLTWSATTANDAASPRTGSSAAQARRRQLAELATVHRTDDLPELERQRHDLLHLPGARRRHGTPTISGLLEHRDSATTPAPPDTTPPTAPRTCSASAVSSTQMDLAWTASTDDSRSRRLPDRALLRARLRQRRRDRHRPRSQTTFTNSGLTARPPTTTGCAPRT